MQTKLKESYLLALAQYLTILFPLATIIEKTPPDVIGSSIAVLFLLRSILFNKWEFLKHDWVRIGIGFWLFQMLSSLWAYDAKVALMYGLIWGRFLLFGIALAYWVLEDPKMHKRLFASILLSIGLLSVDSIYQYYNGVDLIGKPKFEHRLTGPFDMPRVGSAILYLIFPLLSYAIASDKCWRTKLPLMFLSMLGVMSILMSGDRSPAVLLVLEFGLLFLLFLRCRKIMPFIALVAVIATGIIVQMGALDRFTASSNNYITDRQIGSTISMVGNFWESPYGLLVQDTIPVIEKHLLLGVGAGNFRVYLCNMGNMKYYNEGCPIHPHNQYLDIMASTGIAGLTIYLLLIGALVRKLYLTFAVWSKDPIAIGLVTGFICRAWPIIFATAYTRSYTGFTFWLLVGWAISRIDRKQPLM